MAKKTKATRQRQLDLLELIQQNRDARETVKAMLTVQGKTDEWRGIIAVPAGTLVDRIITAFRDSSDIPLESPFFATLHFLSAELLKRDFTIDFEGDILRPDLWTILLAESGLGKSKGADELKRITGIDSMPEAVSAAAFVEVLSRHNRGLWLRDEIGEWLKNIDTQTYLADMKDILLRIYSGNRIERITKKESIVIENPALTIYGLTVYSTFLKHMGVENLLDGFAQRFSYVIADPDPTRPPGSVAIYKMRRYEASIKEEWEALLRELPPDGTVFKVTDKALEAFELGFKLLMPPASELPISFFRRIMFRGVRYALLYHILMHQPGAEITAQDMAWAGRLCGLHIKDAARIVLESGGMGGELGGLIVKAQALKKKMSDEGKEMKPRDLVIGVWGIKSVGEAKGIMSILE